MGADVPAMQGARTSATMIFTMLIWVNSIPPRQGLNLSDAEIVISQESQMNTMAADAMTPCRQTISRIAVTIKSLI